MSEGFEAGALVFRIQAQGAQVFQRDVSAADKAVEGLATSSGKAASSTEELGRKQDKTTESTRKSTEQTKRHTREQESAEKSARDLASAQQEVGTALAGVGAAMVATTGLAVKAAVDWESAWAGVTKTVDGTPEQLAAIQQGLRDMTAELPSSHAELAAVAEAAGQLGIQTDSILGFTKTMVDLGETTNLSSDEAATQLARFMNIMGTAQGDVSRLGSAVVGLGNNYATTEAEIVAMSMRLAGAGKQVGLTEGEVLGLATALSSVGIEAEAGGSAISTVMIKIASAVDEGGESLEEFATASGLSADEFAEKWKKDPATALQAFVKGLANAESQGKSTIGMLSDLGIKELRQRDALLRASAAGDLFAEAMAQGNQEFETNNALTNEANKRYETTAAQLEMMKNQIVDAAISMGSTFLPVLTDVAGAVSTVTGFIAGLPAPLHEAVGVLGLGAGAVALFGGAMLLAIPKIVAFNEARAVLTTQMPRTMGAFTKFTNFMTGPWGIALVAGGLAIEGLKGLLDSAASSSEELQASLTNVEDASEITTAFTKGSKLKWFTDVEAQFDDLDATLTKSRDQWSNWWKRLPGVGYGSELGGFHDALKKMGEELSTLSQTDLAQAQAAFKALADETDGSRVNLWALLANMPDYQDALIKTAEAQGINIDSMSEHEKQLALIDLAMGRVEESTDGATGATEDAADVNAAAAENATATAEAYLEQADAVEELEDNLKKLLDQINRGNDANQNAITTSANYQETLDDVREQIRAITEGQEGYARTLDEGEQAGRDNMRLLQQQAEDARDYAEAQLFLDSNTADYMTRLEKARGVLIENAEAFGYSAEEAQGLADKIFELPTEHDIEVLLESTGAKEQIEAFQAFLDQQPLTIGINPVMSGMSQYDLNGNGVVDKGEPGWGVLKQADGAVVSYHANGSVSENHVAQIARAGEWRVWAEDETGGETYVPHAMSKRGRSEQIMAQTAAIFGGTYIPAGTSVSSHANGSVSAAPAGGGALRLELVNRTGVNILDYIDVRIADSRQADDNYVGGLG